jgi:hypothetical protein
MDHIIENKKIDELKLSRELEEQNQEILVDLKKEIQKIVRNKESLKKKIYSLDLLNYFANVRAYEDCNKEYQEHQKVMQLLFLQIVDTLEDDDNAQLIEYGNKILHETNTWFSEEYRSRSLRYLDFKAEHTKLINDAIMFLDQEEQLKINRLIKIQKRKEIIEKKKLALQFKEHYKGEFILCKERYYTNNGYTFYIQVQDSYKEAHKFKGYEITEKFKLYLTFENTIYKIFYPDISNLIALYYCGSTIENPEKKL